MNQSDRMTRVEVEVIALKDSLDAHKKDVIDKFDSVNVKLDDLLALRNKGAGVLWLISTITTLGVIGGLTEFVNYLFGHK